jgi:hypothetical protein
VSEVNWLDMHKHATTNLEGEFPVVIVEATVAKTNDQSKDMIKCKVKIESGPFVDRPMNVNFTISPESPVAMRIMFAAWAVLGLDQKFFTANPNAPLAMIAQSLIGRRAIAVVGTRQWQGRDFEDIKEWKPALGGPGSTMPLGSSVGGPLAGGLAGRNSSPLASSAATPSGPSSPVSAPATKPPVDAAQPTTEAPALRF